VCGVVYPALRPEAQLHERCWEMCCPNCGRELAALPTDESKPLSPTSIYAISKRDQEEMCLALGRAYRIPTTVLRYFNAYGPRQALSNPYTGIAAIFSSSILNGNPPLVFEDGLQTRDFIHVNDIVQANMLVLENAQADYEVFNVGSGRATSILKVAQVLAQHLNRPDLQPRLAQRFRSGDIRHCYADIRKLEQAVGFAPQVDFEAGVLDLIDWVSRQDGVLDRMPFAQEQLDRRGLIR
jgi:dTDP-L-rhamnose 4-epimerase